MSAKDAIGRLGIWSIELRSDDPAHRDEIRQAAAELDELGYGAIWLGFSPGVGHAEPVLEATSRITVATGIVSIWQYPAAEVAASAAELGGRFSGRFVLGLGASHGAFAPGYHKPYSATVRYLDELDASPSASAPGVASQWRVLAALGPRMLELSRDRTAGAHPYMISLDYIAEARSLLGADALLAPEINVVLETDPDLARKAARGRLAVYLGLPNYTENFKRLGFTEDDFRDGGSDRLIDTLFLWGTPEQIRTRAEEFYAAGADHLALQVARVGGDNGFPRDEWRRLAEAFR